VHRLVADLKIAMDFLKFDHDVVAMLLCAVDCVSVGQIGWSVE
jgi:hypothetical protein